jgi:hypothetical protein
MTGRRQSWYYLQVATGDYIERACLNIRCSNKLGIIGTVRVAYQIRTFDTNVDYQLL